MHADRFASCTIDNISDTIYQVKIHKLFKINIIVISASIIEGVDIRLASNFQKRLINSLHVIYKPWLGGVYVRYTTCYGGDL